MFKWLGEIWKYHEILTAGEWLAVSTALFVVMFVGSLAFTIWMLVKIPATYFLDSHPHALAERHPVFRWAGLIGKNILGGVLIVVGIILSLPGVPGQGLLTIVIGLFFVNFPGKRRLEKWLITRPSVTKSVNRLRQRFGAEPVQIESLPKNNSESQETGENRR